MSTTEKQNHSKVTWKTVDKELTDRELSILDGRSFDRLRRVNFRLQSGEEMLRLAIKNVRGNVNETEPEIRQLLLLDERSEWLNRVLFLLENSGSLNRNTIAHLVDSANNLLERQEEHLYLAQKPTYIVTSVLRILLEISEAQECYQATINAIQKELTTLRQLPTLAGCRNLVKLSSLTSILQDDYEELASAMRTAVLNSLSQAQTAQALLATESSEFLDDVLLALQTWNTDTLSATRTRELLFDGNKVVAQQRKRIARFQQKTTMAWTQKDETTQKRSARTTEVMKLARAIST